MVERGQEFLYGLLTLAEAAERLDMLRPNVRKFLERRGIAPAVESSRGPLWRVEDVDGARAEREADAARMRADRRRRETAVRRRRETNEQLARAVARQLGHRERAVMAELGHGPLRADANAVRHALRRLRARGLVESGSTEDGPVYRLTAAGRDVAGAL